MNLNDISSAASGPVAAARFADEDARLQVVGSFAPDALEDDPELKAIAGFAARLCDVPVAQVTLVEETRQRFLAGEGLEVRETPREVSFCVHAMNEPELMEVRDATRDPRFAENPLVTGPASVRFYAGQALVSDEGVPLGALCVIDTQPRPEGLTDLQRQGLAVLGQAVMRRLNARRADIFAARKMEQQQDRMVQVIEGLPQIAWSAGPDGNFDYFNARWEQQIGTAPPKVAEDWRPFIHPDDTEKVFGDWFAAFANGEEFDGEYRLLHADGNYRWVLSRGIPVAEEGAGKYRWFGTITEIDALRRALEQRDMLARELSHRIKNIFAVMIGLASLKVRKTPEHEPFAHELIEVLRALGRAHEFVQPGAGIAQDKLQGLLAALFAPYSGDEGEARVRVNGADTDISQQVATPLALVFHELATNSAKYGALSTDAGYVTLDVEDRGDEMVLRWTEHGGPPAEDTGTSGFGSRLVEMSVKGQLGGSWERRFTPEGLVVEMTVSKHAISR